MSNKTFACMVIIIISLAVSCTTRQKVQQVSSEVSESMINIISDTDTGNENTKIDSSYIAKVLEWNAQIDTLLNHGENYYDLGSRYVFDLNNLHITVVVYSDHRIAVWTRPIGTYSKEKLTTWAFDQVGLDSFVDPIHKWFLVRLTDNNQGLKYCTRYFQLSDEGKRIEFLEPNDKDEIKKIQEAVSTLPEETGRYLTFLATEYGYKP